MSAGFSVPLSSELVGISGLLAVSSSLQLSNYETDIHLDFKDATTVCFFGFPGLSGLLSFNF